MRLASASCVVMVKVPTASTALSANTPRRLGSLKKTGARRVEARVEARAEASTEVLAEVLADVLAEAGRTRLKADPKTNLSVAPKLRRGEPVCDAGIGYSL
jgi:hypothetical protein